MKTKVTLREVIGIIARTVKGTNAISIDAVTAPDMLKTGNPYWDKAKKQFTLLKSCTMNGLIGFDYENAVNNQAGREGLEQAREAKPRAWGVLSADRIFVLHKGKTYLQMKVQSASDPIYFDRVTGEVVDVLSLKPFMAEKKISSTQEGLEKEIIVRDITMENIIGLRFCGAEYEVVPETVTDEVNAETEAVPV